MKRISMAVLLCGLWLFSGAGSWLFVEEALAQKRKGSKKVTAKVSGGVSAKTTKTRGGAGKQAKQKGEQKKTEDEQVGDGVTANKKLDVRFKRITSKSSKKSCSIKTTSTFSKVKRWGSIMRKVNRCVQGRHWDAVAHAGSQMARFRPRSPWGAYYMSLAAEGKKHYQLALWMIDLAMKKDIKVSVLHYQKARVLWLLEQEELAKKEMKIADEISNKKTRVPEVSLSLGLAGFSAQDCDQAMGYFEKLTSKQIRTYQLTVPYSECMAQKGQIKKAIQLVQKHLSRDRDPAVMLQRGRLEEFYRKDLATALKVYEVIAKYAKSKAMLDWIRKKTIFLQKATAPKVALDNKGKGKGKEGKQGAQAGQAGQAGGQAGQAGSPTNKSAGADKSGASGTAKATPPSSPKRDVSGVQQAENTVKKEEEQEEK